MVRCYDPIRDDFRRVDPSDPDFKFCPICKDKEIFGDLADIIPNFPQQQKVTQSELDVDVARTREEYRLQRRGVKIILSVEDDSEREG
jgi:hypothetical protein